MSCLQICFVQFKQENCVVLVIFVIVGDLDYVFFLEIFKGLLVVGVDVIELGMLFIDLMVDGLVIQLVNICVLDGGQILVRMLQMVCEFCSGDSEMFLVLMGYFNLIYYYGVECFIVEVKEVGVDGLIVVDLLLEYNEDFCYLVQVVGIDFICLIILIIGDQCLLMVLEGSFGFVYYVLVVGVIGVNVVILEYVEEVVVCLCWYIDLLIGIGFGICSVEYVVVVVWLVDGVVVGLVLIDWIVKVCDNVQVVKDVFVLCGELVEGVCNVC